MHINKWQKEYISTYTYIIKIPKLSYVHSKTTWMRSRIYLKIVFLYSEKLQPFYPFSSHCYSHPPISSQIFRIRTPSISNPNTYNLSLTFISLCPTYSRIYLCVCTCNSYTCKAKKSGRIVWKKPISTSSQFFASLSFPSPRSFQTVLSLNCNARKWQKNEWFPCFISSFYSIKCIWALNCVY